MKTNKVKVFESGKNYSDGWTWVLHPSGTVQFSVLPGIWFVSCFSNIDYKKALQNLENELELVAEL